MKQNRQNIASIDTSRKDVAFGPQVYTDEAVFLKTDIGKHELIIVLRPKNLSQKIIETEGASNQSPDLTFSNELFETIINYLKGAGEIVKIFFQMKDEVLRIWTVLPDYENEKKRKVVYHQEKLLMKELRSRKYRFDFYIIEEDEASEVLSCGAILIFDKYNQ